MVCPTPFKATNSHKMVQNRHPNPPHSVEEMARRIKALTCLRHFWKLRCGKSARRCGAKHISKSKCTKHIKTPHVRATFGGSDVGKVYAVVARRCAKHISKSKCTKHIKTPHVRATFGSSDVENVYAIVARSTCRSQNVKSTRGFGPLLEVQVSLRFTTLHYTTLRYTTLHYTALPSTRLHYITLTLHYTPLHYNYNYNYD